MKGGGDWESYCPACGLPFGAGYGMEHGHAWMTSALGFETGNESRHFIIPLTDYNYKGTMSFVPDVFYNENVNDADEFNILDDSFTDGGRFEGIAVHHDCVRAIEQKLGRALTYRDAILLKENGVHENLMGHNGQEFDWEGASELPEWMFESPLSNNQALNRIVSNLPEEIKEQSKIRTNTIKTLLKHKNGLPNALLPNIASYVTGLKGGKRKTRKSNRSRKGRKSTRANRRR